MKPPNKLTWKDLEPLRLCIIEIATLPIREKGIVLPTAIRNRLLDAGHQVWPERSTQYPVRFDYDGAERCLTVEGACALRDRIQRAIDDALPDGVSLRRQSDGRPEKA